MINKLSPKLANQIAAGEVVDNPASIIKELIENSIDANSQTIIISLHKGGLNKIIVEDDGEGILKEDILKAFERFATSKISDIKDLNNIQTLGFRGEALPSIASVSHINIQSKHNKSKLGFQTNIIAGKTSNIIPSNIEYGTIIEVSNLFFNVPARKKFLKSENSEYRKILKVFKNFSLCHFDTNFKLFNNEKNIYNFKAESLIERINSIFGKEFKNSCIPINYKKDNYKISGYIGNLSVVKNRSGNQYLYINKRNINNQLINFSIYNSYRSILARGEYPSFTLFLDLPPELLDVNVHPKKQEVKFENELQVQYIFRKATSEALRDILNTIPNYNLVHEKERTDGAIGLPFNSQDRIEANLLSIDKDIQKNYIKKAEIRLNIKDDKTINLETNNIWQIHSKYIVTEIKSGLILIDQHVAHERILYESALKALEGNGLSSQKILFPKTINFDAESYTYAVELFYYLKQIGFEFRDFGNNSIIIEGVPSDLPYGKEEEVINDILEKYMKTKKISSSFVDYIAATYSCKAAIKAGEKLTIDECKELVDQLFATEHPYYCPHGRPIIVNLSIDDIDKRFERH